MDFLKKNWTLLIIIALAVLLFFSRNPFGCNKPLEPTITTKRDTSIIYVPQPPIVLKEYVPYPVQSQVQQLPASYQNLPSDVAKLQQMMIELANKYYTQNTYKDSITLKDSAGKRVGIVNLEDMVSENMIKSRKPSYQLEFPTTIITNTTTITQPYQPKRQLYIGGELLGNQSDLLDGISANLLYKNKKDQIYGFSIGGAFDNNTIKPQFGISMYWKIGKK